MTIIIINGGCMGKGKFLLIFTFGFENGGQLGEVYDEVYGFKLVTDDCGIGY